MEFRHDPPRTRADDSYRIPTGGSLLILTTVVTGNVGSIHDAPWL
jgi:hypothetical protein